MKIKTQDYNDVTVIEMQGELDSESADVFQNSIMQVVHRGRAGIVLDMSCIGFIDSQGLERLLLVRQHCHEQGCQFRLAGLDETCLKILEITRLLNEFDRYDELSKAVKSFA
jgi:anti-sigma B factor antagonist